MSDLDGLEHTDDVIFRAVARAENSSVVGLDLPVQTVRGESVTNRWVLQGNQMRTVNDMLL